MDDICRKFDPHLSEYISGELPSEKQDALEEHLSQCVHCRTSLEYMEKGRDAIQYLVEQAPTFTPVLIEVPTPDTWLSPISNKMQNTWVCFRDYFLRMTLGLKSVRGIALSILCLFTVDGIKTDFAYDGETEEIPVLSNTGSFSGISSDPQEDLLNHRSEAQSDLEQPTVVWELAWEDGSEAQNGVRLSALEWGHAWRDGSEAQSRVRLSALEWGHARGDGSEDQSEIEYDICPNPRWER